MDKDGKVLPEDAAAAKKLKVEAPKPKEAAPTYVPQGPLKSKYHIQVCLAFLPCDAVCDPMICPLGKNECCPVVSLLLPTGPRTVACESPSAPPIAACFGLLIVALWCPLLLPIATPECCPLKLFGISAHAYPISAYSAGGFYCTA